MSRTVALAVTGDMAPLSKRRAWDRKPRIILELKDKLSKEVDVPAPDAAAADAPPASGVIGEAQNALLVLGYSRAEAMWATKDADPSAGLEAVIREALRRLMKG